MLISITIHLAFRSLRLIIGTRLITASVRAQRGSRILARRHLGKKLTKITIRCCLVRAALTYLGESLRRTWWMSRPEILPWDKWYAKPLSNSGISMAQSHPSAWLRLRLLAKRSEEQSISSMTLTSKITTILGKISERLHKVLALAPMLTRYSHIRTWLINLRSLVSLRWDIKSTKMYRVVAWTSK